MNIRTARKYILPALAVIGVIHAFRVIAAGNNPPPLQVPLAEPAKPPYAHFVAGAGMIESRGENIAIASHVGGIVEKVHVQIGQQVRAGDPLFTLDQRRHLADRAVKEANVRAAAAALDDAQRKLALYNKILDRRALSEDQIIERQTAVAVADARRAQADAELRAAIADVDLLTVKAPIDGTVLQVKVRPGEFAPAQLLSNPLMMIGDTSALHVRVDIDENDAWRVRPGAAAVANARGNAEIRVVLSFVRFEPYVIPKRSLTGEGTERVDTRVLQAVYQITNADPRIFVGQLVDVFIEAES